MPASVVGLQTKARLKVGTCTVNIDAEHRAEMRWLCRSLLGEAKLVDDDPHDVPPFCHCPEPCGVWSVCGMRECIARLALLTDVAASELLADRADDGVADDIPYSAQVLFCERMLVHEGVHGGKDVCRGGWSEGP